jgi:CHASE2 domain-containing sensor protein
LPDPTLAKRLTLLAGPLLSLVFGAWLINFPPEATQEELMPWMTLHALAVSGVLLTWCYFDANARRFPIPTAMTLLIILIAVVGFTWYLRKTRHLPILVGVLYTFLFAGACQIATRVGFVVAHTVTGEGPPPPMPQ